jgi:RNA polymerase sigma-70 factor (ECF subfamily)
VAEDERRGLLEAARGGDGQALDDLLKDVEPRLYRFSLKMCRRPEDAQDVLQETMLAVFRSVAGFRGDASVSTWLYTIARSFCIKKRRRRVFAPEVVSLEASPAAGRAATTARDPEQSLADRELADALGAAIASLEPAAREVLVLRDVEGLPASEVAAITGASLSAVKSRLHRARLAVRERLAPMLAPAPSDRGAGTTRPCPDVARLLSRHLEGEIGPEDCADMERHVAACNRCRARCASLRETLRVCGASPTPAVPAHLQASIRKDIQALLIPGPG